MERQRHLMLHVLGCVTASHYLRGHIGDQTRFWDGYQEIWDDMMQTMRQEGKGIKRKVKMK